MFISSTTIRVRYAETDQMGVVYHGNYFAWFEYARAEAIREMGLTYADMEKMGIIMPVIDVHARFLRPARYDELVTVKTMLKELPLHHKIEFHHEVYNEKEQLLTTGRIILYFMDKTTGHRSTMPESLRQQLEKYFQ
ncbi:MAG: YbgC/FadM family acyl-CoA thioesterase [Terrimonas sp.]|nr:YbgC/FadM family acyl-CoA thioesterase [Terrimonas sp.]